MANKEANNQKENSKNKKSFFKDFKAELKKVSWPTPKQLLNNTTAVVTIVIITAIIVFALDVVFETLNKHGIDRIKEVITTDNSVSDETTSDNTENESNDEEIGNEDEETEISEEEKKDDNTEASDEEIDTTTENNVEN